MAKQVIRVAVVVVTGGYIRDEALDNKAEDSDEVLLVLAEGTSLVGNPTNEAELSSEKRPRTSVGNCCRRRQKDRPGKAHERPCGAYSPASAPPSFLLGDRWPVDKEGDLTGADNAGSGIKGAVIRQAGSMVDTPFMPV